MIFHPVRGTRGRLTDRTITADGPGRGVQKACPEPVEGGDAPLPEAHCLGDRGAPRICLYHPLPGEEGGRGDGRKGCMATTLQ